MATPRVHAKTVQALPARAAVQPRETSRLLYIDNIRVLLTILVILFHLMITYAGTGSWYYTEGREDFVTGALGAWFLAVNQAYFMGLFLLVSAYFVPGSYDRKRAGHFLADRLIRLGIPLALYSWIIRPLLAYLDPVRYPDGRPPFWSFITASYFRDEAVLGAGPLWFIETLLIFSLVYVLWRRVTGTRAAEPEREARFPGNGAIALFALLVGLVAFLIRIWLPMGWNFVPLNLQFPYFAQYIALFVVGMVAYRRGWLRELPATTGRLWLGIAGFLILAFWPLIIAGGALEQDLTALRGGVHWQALAYAMWESLLSVSMSIGLIFLFRRYGDHQGSLARFFSRNAYAAYLVHEVVIVVLAYAGRDLTIYPLFKWGLMSLIAVPLCFALGDLIRKLPYASRVL